MEARPRCFNCEIEIPWTPIVREGRQYCCEGCARGGPCICNYSQQEVALVVEARVAHVAHKESARREEAVVEIARELGDGRVQGLGEVFLERVYHIPDGERIKACLQCGTCSGSCPTSYAMDYTPREIIAAFRAGMLDRVLRSNTVWMCASCYYCTVRCPAGIKLTDVMYELKRLGIEYGLYPKGAKAPTLSRTFMEIVDRRGRSSEGELLMRYYLRSGLLGSLGALPLALRLLLRGRLPLLPERIKGQKELHKMVQWVRGRENGYV